MQLKQSNDVSQQYKGTIAGIKKIVREEGLAGLYKGIIFHDLVYNRCCAEIDSVCTQRGFSLHV